VMKKIPVLIILLMIALYGGYVRAGDLPDWARPKPLEPELANSKKYFKNLSVIELEKLANDDSCTAMYYLGKRYEGGIDVYQDIKMAVYWYEKSAELGCPESMTALGILYLGNVGVIADYDKARHWLSRGADAGDAAAMFNLGLMYQAGLGVPKDYKKAFKWYKKADERGNTTAMNKLGQMYQYGTGVNVDYKKSVFWYKKAAEKGDTSAMVNLAVMYEKGLGVEMDYRQANYWYEKGGSSARAGTNVIEVAPRPYSIPHHVPGITYTSGCFIATAAYGSAWERHVLTLREFRDRFLLPNRPGRWFVETYYRFSPPLARAIEGHEVAKAVVRVLLTPVVIVAGASLGNRTDMLIGMAFMAGLAAAFWIFVRYRKAKQRV